MCLAEGTSNSIGSLLRSVLEHCSLLPHQSVRGMRHTKLYLFKVYRKITACKQQECRISHGCSLSWAMQSNNLRELLNECMQGVSGHQRGRNWVPLGSRLGDGIQTVSWRTGIGLRTEKRRLLRTEWLGINATSALQKNLSWFTKSPG